MASSAAKGLTEYLDEWKKPIAIGLGVTGVVGCAWYLYKHNAAPGGVKGGLPKVAVVPPSQRSNEEAESNGVKKASGPSDLKNAGNTHFKRGEYKRAIELYTEAIEMYKRQKRGGDTPMSADAKDLATFYQNRAAAHEKLHDTMNVITDCTSAIELNKGYNKAYQRRAKAYAQSERFKESLQDWTLLCILEQFSNQTTLEEADKVLKQMAERKAADLIKTRGPNHVVPMSISFVESYLTSFCEDPVLSHITVDIQRYAKKTHKKESMDPNLKGMERVKQLLKHRQYEEVPKACDEEIEADGPSTLECLVIKATFALIQGRSDESSANFDMFFTKFNQLDKKAQEERKELLVNAHIKRGSYYMQLGNKDDALADFKQAIETDDKNADVYHHRGQLLMLMGSVEEALADFQKCISLRSDFALTRVQEAYAQYRHAQMGNSTLSLNKAINKFENVVREFSDCAEGYALLGQVYAEKESFDDAEEMFKESIKLQPNNPNTYVHMGLLELTRNENIDSAKKIMQKALDVDPHCEFAYETMGNLEVQRGQFGMALEYFDRALNLARTQLEIVHLLGLREAAIAQLGAARAIGITMPPAGGAPGDGGFGLNGVV